MASNIDFAAIFDKQITAEDSNMPTDRVAGAIGMPAEESPEELSRMIQVGQELGGVPSSVVKAAPELFQQQLDTKRAKNVLKGAPATTSWLEDAENRGVARDDLVPLTDFERTINSFKKGFNSGFLDHFQPAIKGVKGTFQGGLPSLALSASQIPRQGSYRDNLELMEYYGQIAGMNGEVDLKALGIENELSMEASLALGFANASDEERDLIMADTVAALSRDREFLDEVGAKLKEYGELQAGLKGNIPDFTDIKNAKDFSDWLLYTTGEGIPYMAITAIAGLATGPIGAFGAGYGMGVGDISSELIQQGIYDQPDAALLGAVPYAGLELLGPAARPFRGVGGEVLEQVAEGWAKRQGKKITGNFVEEFINEAGQEIIKDLTVQGAGGEDVVLDNETLLGWFNSGMAGGGSGVSMGGIMDATGAVATKVRDRAAVRARQAATARHTTHVVETIGNMANASKLKANDPQKFQQVLDAQGWGDQNLEVSAEEVNTFFQGEIDDQTLEQLGVNREDFDAALLSGGEVSIPTSNYAAHFANTDLDAVIKEHGRFQGNGMSTAEARSFTEGEARQIADDIARAVEEQGPELDVETFIADRLMAVKGFSPKVASTQALVHGNFWKALAAKKGITDVSALASRFGLDIQGASDTPSGDALDQGAMGVPAAGPSSPQFKSWFGASRAVSTDGTPIVVYRGEHGLRPEGQDFQTQLGSLTFSSAEAASLYAEDPNDSRMTAEAPQVIPAYVKIENPIIENIDDPFAEFGDIADKMGLDYAVALAKRFSKDIENTGNWMETIDPENETTVEEYLDANPENVRNLYTTAYALLDDPQFVADAKAAGFDGAIHMGMGAMDDTEYRVFDPSQVKSIFNQGTFDPNNPSVLHQNSPPLDPNDNRIADGVMTFEDSGLPVHLYHGTNQMFSTFRDGRIFLTTDRGLANQHATRAGLAGARLVEANVVIENPLVIEIPNDQDPDIYWLNNAFSIESDFDKPDADGDPYDAIVVHRADGSNVMVIATKNDQIKQLHAEGGTFYQSAAPLQADPIPMLGTGPGGRVLNWDLGTALTERHTTLYGGPLDLENPEHYDMALEHLLEDYAEQQKQPDNGVAWYSDDIAAAIETTKEIIPELNDPLNRDIFLTMAAFLSPQQGPVMNWENAILAMRGYLDSPDRRIPLIKPNGKNYGVASHANGLRMLQHLIDTMGEVDAIHWLNTEHTGYEMAEMRKASGIFTEHKTLGGYKPSEMNLGDVELGVYMLGPKVGDFALNSTGADSQAVTVDLWAARTYNRLVGRLLDVSPGSQAERKVASDVRGKKERVLIKRLFRDAAEQVGIEPSSMQAALWYFEQRLYRAHGIRSESKSFSDAAGASVASRGNTETQSGSAAQGAPRGSSSTGDGSGRDQVGAAAPREGAPLDGAPDIEGATGPDLRLVAIADAYAQSQGIELRRQASFATVDEEFAARVADEYEAMEHNPSDPAVAEAYENLIQQTMAQYEALVEGGYSFTFFDSESDPYDGNPFNAMRDLRANQTMAVYGTYDGYGTEGITDSDTNGNPMLVETGLEWPDQNGEMKPVTANDLFRAVHDAFGHGIEGSGFRAVGEENAWQAHVRLFTGSAVAAITSETRGQNSWLNYGPHGETNRTAGLADTVFAEQKTGLMPEWTWMENRVGDMNPGPRTLYQNEALANELGMHSGVEQAALRMNVPAFNTSKKNPEGRALGKDIWAKLQKEPGVKKEELQWLGLEDWLTLNEGDRFTREEVVAFIRENGVGINELVKEDGGGEAGFIDASEDWTREVIADEEQWEHLVVDMLGDYNANLDETSGIDIDDWMDTWLMQNAETVLDNMGEVIGEIDAEVMAEARQLLEDNDPRALIDALDEEVADLRTQFREMARDDFEISANVQAEQEYMQNPDEYAELTTGGGETGLGVFVMGNEEFGYAVAEGRSGEKPTRLVDELGMNLSFNEASVRARDYAYEIVDIASLDTNAHHGEHVMDGDHTNYREHLITLPKLPGNKYVKQAHFSEENVVTFIRSTDRVLGDNDFDTSFFVEELQSDWHQDGRQFGYQSEQSKDYLNESITLKRELSEMAAQAWEFVPDSAKGFFTYGEPGASHFQNFIKAAEQIVSDQGWYDVDQKNTVLDAINASEVSLEAFQEQGEKLRINRKNLKYSRKVVPDAPFKGDGWISLGVKRALIKAVEEGKTSFAWADSNTVIDRWDDQSAELFRNVYDLKMVGLVKRLTGVEPQRFKSDGSENNITRQSWIDRHLIIERDDGLYEIHNIDGKATAMNFDNRLQAESVLESMADDATLIPGYWKIEITDELRAKMTDTTLPLFQDKPDAPRGQIDLPAQGVGKGTSLIRLFKSSDMSTFLHESAHFFLEVMNVLSKEGPELDADMAIIRKFVGATDDQNGFTRDQHEKWARGFEKYLMEGMAPSLELADAFSMFKTWLIEVYKSALKLNVQLNPEIRGVYDRMLATDEAIDAARADMVMRTLFREKPGKMTDTDWRTYQRMARRSEEQAEQHLLGKMMAKITRETKKWYKDEKEAVTAEVRRDMAERREYRLIEAMANGRWLNEEDETEVPDMRIDRRMLSDEFDEETVKALSKNALGGKRGIVGKDGMSPGEVAEFFGFESSVEMVAALKAAPKMKDAIDAEVERTMLERHGDPFTDGTIQERAMEAVHNEQQAATVVQEVRELKRQLGRKHTGTTVNLYRVRAQEMIGKMTVGQASRPAQFLAAERKAAREAEAAFAKVARGGGRQDLEAAHAAKERQALNHALYNEAKKVEAEVTSGRARMMKYRKPSVREKLEGSYIEMIDGLLEQYDFRQRTQNQVQRNANLTAYIDEMIEAGREAELNIDPRLIENARRTNYKNMSVSELRGLFDTIENIDHMGRFKQKLIERKRKRELKASAERAAAAVRKNQKARQATNKPRRGQQALNLLSKPDTVMIRMDGGDEFGAFWEEVKRGIDEATGDEVEMQQQMAKDVDALYSKHYSQRTLRRMAKAKAIDGVRHPWSKLGILALAMNMGAASNYQRVMDQNVHETRRLDQDQLDALLNTLDDNDWQFVQGQWDMINGYYPDMAAVHKRRTGTEPVKVEAVSMWPGAPAFVRGGYYPLKYDPALSELASQDEETATDKFMTSGRSSTAQVGNGMTKARQETAGGRTVRYDLQVAFGHMRETIRFITLSEAIDASYRVLNHPAVTDAMRATDNLDTHQTLNLWLMDTAQGPIFNNDLGNTMARMVKNNFTMSRLAFNMKTILLQVTGLTQSAVVIGKRNMVRGMVQYYRRPHQMVADVLAVSPKMRERQTTMQKDIYDFASDMEATTQVNSMFKNAKNATAKIGFWPIVALQFYIVDMPTWLGAYSKYLKEYDGDKDRAVLAADKMVERAQDTGITSERAAVERGTLSKTTRQADMVRIFTTLGGYMLTKANRGGVAILQGRQNMREADGAVATTAAAANMALNMMILFAFEGLMMGLMYEMLDDDDDDEDLRKFLLKETGSAMVGGVPLVRDAASAFNGFGGGGVYGSVMEIPANAFVQATQGENDRAFRRSMGDIIGVATGLPTTAALRAIEAVIDDDVPLSEGLLGRNPLNR